MNTYRLYHAKTLKRTHIISNQQPRDLIIILSAHPFGHRVVDQQKFYQIQYTFAAL